ncbi:MAG: hypothetical protein KDD40_10805 [Bdellovibrionales bacterium]|nr:hypothetical protein [Bdellovibrionales bacterium]
MQQKTNHLKKQLLSFFYFVLLTVDVEAEWSVDQSAKVNYSQQFFLSKLPDKNVKNNYSILEVSPQLQLKKANFKFYAQPLLYHKFTTNYEVEKNFFDPKDSYLEGLWGSWRIRIGSQIHNWGVIDLYSPGDIVNSSTLFDPLHPQKLGAVGVDLTWSTFGKKLQFLYLPIRRRTQLPAQDSRWLPRDIITNAVDNHLDIYLPESINYIYDKNYELPDALTNNFGTRLSLTFGEVDWHLFYFHGLSPIPQMEIEATAVADVIDPTTSQLMGVKVEPDVFLRPIEYGLSTLGNSLVWAPEWAILRWETIYADTFNKDPRVVNERLLQSALSIEKQLNVFDKNLIVQVQYYLAERKQALNNITESNFQIFADAMVLNSILAINDNNSLYFSQLFNFESSSYLTALGGVLKINDMFSVESKVAFLNGPSNTIIGTFKNNDLVEVKLNIYY